MRKIVLISLTVCLCSTAFSNVNYQKEIKIIKPVLKEKKTIVKVAKKKKVQVNKFIPPVFKKNK